MKTTKSSLSLFVLLSIFMVESVTVKAQDGVPDEVKSIVNMPLEKAQEKLSGLGYEICHSSFLNKKQDWYNEKAKICVTINFDKKTKAITKVDLNPETSVCQQNLEAARKIWENYHDGQAEASSAKLDEERKKLQGQGFVASYWINDVSPGRCAEYWINESSKQARMIVWEIQGNAWVMTNDAEYERGHNPAPKN